MRCKTLLARNSKTKHYHSLDNQRKFIDNGSVIDINYFKVKENREKFMDNLMIVFNYKSLDEYVLLSKGKLKKLEGGSSLLGYYSKDLKQLLTSTYPNFPFDERKLKKLEMKRKLTKFNDFEAQAKFMDSLFVKLGLKTLDEFLYIARREIIKQGGERLLIHYYSNDKYELLKNIYANYPWNLKLTKSNSNEYFKIKDNQIEFLVKLFKLLNFKNMHDFYSIKAFDFIKHGAKSLLSYYYSNDIPKLVSSLFPNYPWNFSDHLHRNQTIDSLTQSLSNIEKQRDLMEGLFKNKFKLKSLEDWLKVTPSQISKSVAKNFVYFYYSNDFVKLMTTLYPNYPWNFEYYFKSNSHSLFQSLDYQREFMEKLFHEFGLKDLDDWLKVSRRRIIEKGGKSLVLHYYKNDLQLLLSTLYPNHAFNFEEIRQSSKIEYFQNNVNNQRKFMNSLFRKFKLQSLDDFLSISKLQIIQNGGKSLLLHYYNNDYFKLLQSIYPEHDWDINRFYKTNTAEYFKSMNNRITFMNELFHKFKLKSMNDWHTISKHRIVRNGGYALLEYYYDNDMQKLLKSIYPNFEWNFDLYNLSLVGNQRKLMDDLFIKLKLNDLSDWMKVSKHQFVSNGARSLLKLYSCDLKVLLSTIYPEYEWSSKFDGSFSLKFRPTVNYWKSSKEFNIQKLMKLQKEYSIQEMKDWYRVPLRIDEISLYHSLQLLYPEIIWDRSLFSLRIKKTNQRLLFSHLLTLYSPLYLIEDYHHPFQTIKEDKLPVEFDIFIPSLNLAFEYQGEHHYNDLPAVFSFAETYQTRDQSKELLSSKLQIQIISIPYWWDKRLDSLYSSIRKLRKLK